MILASDGVKIPARGNLLTTTRVWGAALLLNERVIAGDAEGRLGRRRVDRIAVASSLLECSLKIGHRNQTLTTKRT
jgi:hypothetical protein